jgi:hypothetical protein
MCNRPEADEEALTIVPASWTPFNEWLIRLALVDATIHDMKAQVEAGAKLFEVRDGRGETLAAFILRVDRMATKNEGVIVAAGGFAKYADLTFSCLPAIEKMFINCQSIRIHTGRAGLAKKLERQGWKVAELVLQKEINHG